jgi:tRNA modification GTPase
MNKTIAAIATAYGKGGISVIRISGDEAIEIASRMFRPSSREQLTEIMGGRAVYGEIIKSGKQIDDGICTVFRAPHSYTGEDVVEISCHGGILITERVLEAAFECGAVQAGAGEFTRRAFFNGKLSLSQVEAVGLLIDAESDEQLSIASAQRRGVFKKKADELYEQLKNVVTSVYAKVDFPDEDLAELSDFEILSVLRTLENELNSLCGSYGAVRAAIEGIRTVIIGKPNTGKSSLLNRLTGRDRAIVTDIAGTTRDTIEETVNIGRVILRLCDTAGIRETTDIVERIGVERSLSELERAELVLALFDLSSPLDREDLALIERLEKSSAEKIAILNKSDISTGEFDRSYIQRKFTHVIDLSAKSGEGFDKLIKIIESLYRSGEIDYDKQAIILNARQNASATRAREYIRGAIKALESGLSPDTAGFDLEAALSELSELDGRRVTEEIVDGIFHRFCVGK